MFNEGSQNFEQTPAVNETEALGNLQVAQPAETREPPGVQPVEAAKATTSISPIPEQAPNDLQGAAQELLAAQQQIQDLTNGTEAAAKAIGGDQKLINAEEGSDQPQSLIVESNADVQDLVASAQADFQQAAAEAEQAASEAEQAPIEDAPMTKPTSEDAPTVEPLTETAPAAETIPMPDYAPMDTEPQAEAEPVSNDIIDQDVNSIQDDTPTEPAPMSPLQALGASPNIQTSMDPLAQEGGAPEGTQDQTEAQPEEEEPEGPLMSIFG